MNQHPPRTFTDVEAQRESVPVLIGLFGASGGGKTRSALELGTGIQQISGGEIFLIDTEAKRAKVFSDKRYYPHLKFRHVEFGEPFGSLDYLAAIRHCVTRGAKIVIVDSMSHEHEGPGGLLEQHEAEAERLMKAWRTDSYEKVQFAAWAKPKAARRRLINSILQMSVNLIFCFRAKESAKQGKNDKGKTDIISQGFVPIAGDEFVYEMSACCLMLPHSGGIPSWRQDFPGERNAQKLPDYFKGILDDGKPLSPAHGRKIAEWARGDADPRSVLMAAGDARARMGSEALSAWWLSLSIQEKNVLANGQKDEAARLLSGWKVVAAKVGEPEPDSATPLHIGDEQPIDNRTLDAELAAEQSQYDNL